MHLIHQFALLSFKKLQYTKGHCQGFTSRLEYGCGGQSI